jgi:pSer/pThr/pTyr-binding forkhead associated (FHA) protein
VEPGGQSFPLQDDRTIVGRVPTCDVVLPDHLVSRQHAEIRRESFGYIVSDLGSSNGTFVNGQRLSADESRPLRDGDTLRLGSSELQFHDPSATLRVPGLSESVAVAPVFLDHRQQEAYVRGQPLSLAPKEFTFLALLAERPGELRRRAEIARLVWPEHGGAVSNYNIDVLASRLRQRLSAAAGPEAAGWLVTVKKRGYRLVAGA